MSVMYYIHQTILPTNATEQGGVTMNMQDKNAEARKIVAGKLTDIGYTVTYLEDESPFSVLAEYEGYSLLADIVRRDRAWSSLDIPADKVKAYDNYDSEGKDKFLIFRTATKRRPECIIRTDDIKRLGFSIGPWYAIDTQWTSSIALLRKLLEKMIV